jgi:hypothetical protein
VQLLSWLLNVLVFLAAHSKLLEPSNWLCTWNIQNFSSQLGYCRKIFRIPAHILVVLGYWAPVKFYLWCVQVDMLCYLDIVHWNKGFWYLMITSLATCTPLHVPFVLHKIFLIGCYNENLENFVIQWIKTNSELDIFLLLKWVKEILGTHIFWVCKI